MRLALISKSRVAGLFVPLGPPPGLILTVGHVGCNRRCANLAVNAFLVPPQLYTVGIDINVKIADIAYLTRFCKEIFHENFFRALDNLTGFQSMHILP